MTRLRSMVFGWVYAVLLGAATLCAQDGAQAPDPDWWSELAGQQLAMSEANRLELEKALNGVPRNQRRGMEFLIENMPTEDLRSLSSSFLLENVELAYLARDEMPWGRELPEDIFLNDVLPYANVDESREPWRREMLERCRPIVADCSTPSKAVQRLNEQLFPLLNVKYGTGRRRANQSPSESIEQSLASCTGLSILLVDACRSVGLPARVVGIPNWRNKRGNHTWVEIWDGQWHFTGACEPDDKGLDHAWFVHDASLADSSDPRHRIYASSFRKTDMSFPLVWNPRNKDVSAVDVTFRYTNRKETAPGKIRVLIRILGRDSLRVRCAVRIRDKTHPLDEQTGHSRSETADLNDLLTFELTPEHEYQVDVEHLSETLTFVRTATKERQQVWEFRVDADKRAD